MLRQGVARAAIAIAIVAAGCTIWSAQAQGAVLAANGFAPDPDGYSFENYGNENGVTNLRPREMQRLFGKRVCVDGGGQAGCVLTPEAESWMNATNAAMAGGHCFGMASTAQFFFDRIGKPPTPAPFGAPTTFGLTFDNAELQAYIAYAWSLQLLPAIDDASSHATPNKVFEHLKKSLATGSAREVLTIFDDGGGHAITPLAVEDDGGGHHRIAVYDNNHPDQTRFVEVDAGEDTWKYGLGGNTVWSGDAETKSLGIVDSSVGLGHQPCFICPASGNSRTPGKRVELHVSPDARSGRHGSIRIADERGRQTGCGPKGCFNRIKGAKLREVASGRAAWKTDSPPVIDLPTRHSYDVRLGATSRRGKVRQGLSVIGRGFSVGATDIGIRKGERDRLKIRRDVHSIAYKNDAKGTESPTIVVTSSNSTGPEVRIAVEPASIDRKAQFAVRFDPRGKLRLVNRRGHRIERAKLTLTEYSVKGKSREADEIKVRRGKGKTIRF